MPSKEVFRFKLAVPVEQRRRQADALREVNPAFITVVCEAVSGDAHAELANPLLVVPRTSHVSGLAALLREQLRTERRITLRVGGKVCSAETELGGLHDLYRDPEDHCLYIRYATVESTPVLAVPEGLMLMAAVLSIGLGVAFLARRRGRSVLAVSHWRNALTSYTLSPSRMDPAAGRWLLRRLTALEQDGAVLLRWAAADACSPLPRILILPPLPSPVVANGLDATPAAQHWFGAFLVRAEHSGEGGSADSALHVAPACLRLFPLVLPRLPARVQAQVRHSGRFASLAGPGFGRWDVGTAAGADDEVEGGVGVALLRGEPPAMRVEAVSGTFPLFLSGRAGVAAEATALCVLPPEATTLAERAVLMRGHWGRLQPFVPVNLAAQLVRPASVEAALATCVWCVVRYPDGDPFPNNEVDSEDAGTTASSPSSSSPSASRLRPTTFRRHVGCKACDREVLLPGQPYYLLPAFLLARYAIPCLGSRSIEPRLRPQAAAAAELVRGMLSRPESDGMRKGGTAVVLVEDGPGPSTMTTAALLQRASAFET